MKKSYQVVIIMSLLSSIEVAMSSLFALSDQSLLSQVRNTNNNIPVNLPSSAKVILNQGGSMSGRLTNIDATNEEITLELSGQSTQVTVKKIKQIEFEGEVILQGQRLVIRGEDNASNNNQKTWTEPLANFTITNAQTGAGEIKLTSITNQGELRGILAVANKSNYVVDQIVFEASGKVRIKVTPR